MAFLQLRSTNKDISYVINKNPSAPMLAKKMRKGVAYGYYDDADNYNIFFQDAFDEISFSKSEDGEFEYLDETRYDSPLFLFTAIRDFFSTALSRKAEKDIDAGHELFLPNYHVAHGKFTEVMDSSFEKFSILRNEFGLTFRGESVSMHEFLNYVYAYCALNLFFGRSPIFFDASFAQRLAVAMNIIDAPYLPRYLAKMVAVRVKSFDTVKETLSSWTEHELVLDSEATAQEARISAVAKHILPNTSIVDFGAGDGQYLFLAKRLPKDCFYLAVDHDDAARKILERKAKDCDGAVRVAEKLDEIDEPYVAIMSEVIEHNDFDEALKILIRFLVDKKCKKLIVTTPNFAFNKNFPNKLSFRHPDHHFELNREQFEAFVSKGTASVDSHFPDVKFQTDFFGVGDVVDGEPITQMAVISKTF